MKKTFTFVLTFSLTLSIAALAKIEIQNAWVHSASDGKSV